MNRLPSTLRSSARRPASSEFLRDVLAGLSRPSKHLACKYFYDEAGSQLFDQICDLPEYYPTRTELAILKHHAPEMADLLGPGCVVIEYGSGSSLKTRLLLDAVHRPPAAYVPVDISHEHLHKSARTLAQQYPDIEVVPVCADFTQPFDLPALQGSYQRRVVYFSGSTIGNFGPLEAYHLLAQIGKLAGVGGGLLIAADLKKDPSILEPAYNDAAGVTAMFNLNLLARINRELGADFALDQFRHHACYNAKVGRIEMYLISNVAQAVHVGGHRFDFAAGERICTEYSYKYGLEEFADLARQAGLSVDRVWTDPQGLFSVQMLTVQGQGEG
jgi:dimethylhistidine N-methyltransferase